MQIAESLSNSLSALVLEYFPVETYHLDIVAMKLSFFLLVSVIGVFNAVISDAAKGRSTVAVPRKSKGNPISRSVVGSIFSRAFREMKVTFCSELEALTLQVKSYSIS